MGVRLDWQIEADHAAAQPGKDPAWRRRRQRALILAFFTVCIITLGIGGVALVAWRINSVDTNLRQGLLNAVRTEISTLKIGDLPGFLAMIRGGGPDWVPSQSARFSRYQDLKQRGTLQFTDTVRDLTVDGQRGRAVVEEIVDGQRQVTLWYYWRYTDGWRHVPGDLTFWGDPETITGAHIKVDYRTLDEGLAAAFAPRLERWWVDGCALLGCTSPPLLTISIVPEPGAPPRWEQSTTEGFELRVGSPLGQGDRTVADPPISASMEEAVAARIAERLFSVATANLETNPNSDATWIRQSIIEYTTAVMLGRGDPAQIAFVQSLRDKYGVGSIPAVLRVLGTNSDISVIGAALGQPLNTLDLDWRSFFQWRLALERELIRANNQREFSALWDNSATALANARARLSRPAAALPIVQAVSVAQDGSGIPTASVQAQENNQAVTLQFRLINGNWKRFT